MKKCHHYFTTYLDNSFSVNHVSEIELLQSIKREWWSFHYHNRNVNPIISKNGDGKNSLFVIQGTIIFPHSRLSSRSEKKFPHSRLRRSWGNFSSLLLLSLSWGNIIVPFMTHREFVFPLLAASPPRRGNIPSPFFKMIGLGHS